jgi:hypothetical protein
MAKEFVNYKSFNDKAVAIELYDKLNREGLQVEWESSVGIFDASFANDEFMHLYYVKLRKEDFSKADAIMMQLLSENNEPPPHDYYLFSFTNKELIDVLKNPDEWNEYDRFWAGKLLQEKSVHVREEEIVQAKTKRLEDLKKPWKLDKVWLLLPGVLLSWGFYYLYFLATIGCIFLGMYITYSKKTMPDGDRVIAFSPEDRSLGKIVMIVSAIITTLIFLIIFGVIELPSFWYSL